MSRFIVVLLLAFVVSACGARDKVLLLPNDDGTSSGAVAVLSNKGETRHVIDKPYTEVAVSADSVSDPAKIDVAALEKRYGALIDHLPAPPADYILYFKEGTVTLVPSSQPRLDALLKDVAQRAGADVQVTGHTDTLGSTKSNDRLSRKRAEEIRRVLIDQGLDPALVRAAGRGERELLVKTPDRTRNAKNRRVVVTVR